MINEISLVLGLAAFTTCCIGICVAIIRLTWLLTHDEYHYAQGELRERLRDVMVGEKEG